eukprot:1335683-Karenia_brevis.AAC.1
MPCTIRSITEKAGACEIALSTQVRARLLEVPGARTIAPMTQGAHDCSKYPGACTIAPSTRGRLAYIHV